VRHHPPEEVEEAVGQYCELRRAIAAGQAGWEALAELFTEDAVFIDPAWGRIEGQPAIRRFLHESMQGLEDWSFPIEWTAVDGDRVVIKWQNRLPGEQPDGSPWQVSGISSLVYAGGGRFSFEEDLLNMVAVNEVIGDSGWRPTGPLHTPPRKPRR